MATRPVEDQLDGALSDILNAGWSDPPSVELPAELEAESQEPEYPPLPVPMDEMGRPIEPHDPDDEDAPRGVFDLGLLTDLATGKKSAVEAAEAAGVTPEALQSQLAVALRQVPPEEINKALGLQAAEQQLKSGALYGAVLSDLVNDMLTGRMKISEKLELAKILARVGRVEPKEDKSTGIGGGFVLNISLGSSDPKPITIEAE